jgi:hypothetical protein
MKNELSTVLAAMLQRLPGVVVGKKFNSGNFTVRKKVFAFTKDEDACNNTNRIPARDGEADDEGMGGDSLPRPC